MGQMFNIYCVCPTLFSLSLCLGISFCSLFSLRPQCTHEPMYTKMHTNSPPPNQRMHRQYTKCHLFFDGNNKIPSELLMPTGLNTYTLVMSSSHFKALCVIRVIGAFSCTLRFPNQAGCSQLRHGGQGAALLGFLTLSL